MCSKLEWLLAQAANQELTITRAQLPPGWRGCYDHANQTITLAPGLTRAQATSTLAHELGHAHYSDDATTPGREARAWQYAARLLITSDEYEAAERAVGCHPGALAVELGVTVPVIIAWRQLHT